MPSHCPPQTTSSGGNGGSGGGGAHMAPGTFLHPNFYHTSPPLRWNNRNVACKYRILSFKCSIPALREHITNSMTQIYNMKRKHMQNVRTLFTLRLLLVMMFSVCCWIADCTVDVTKIQRNAFNRILSLPLPRDLFTWIYIFFIFLATIEIQNNIYSKFRKIFFIFSSFSTGIRQFNLFVWNNHKRKRKSWETSKLRWMMSVHSVCVMMLMKNCEEYLKIAIDRSIFVQFIIYSNWCHCFYFCQTMKCN